MFCVNTISNTNLPINPMNFHIVVDNKELFTLLSRSYFEDRCTKNKYPIFSEAIINSSPFKINNYYYLYIIINNNKHYLTFNDIVSPKSKYNILKHKITPFNNCIGSTITSYKRITKNIKCIRKLKNIGITNSNSILEFKM